MMEKWEEEAQRYARNADYWRARYEKVRGEVPWTILISMFAGAMAAGVGWYLGG